MRRVAQRETVEVDERGVMRPDSPQGDCFPACVASIFESALGSAPGRGGNTQEVHDWLALNFPGIGLVDRQWDEPKEPYYRGGLWIATVVSSRFREPKCHHCSPDRRRKSRPPFFYRRDECPRCEGTGTPPGLHAVVMENARRVWDPHPAADWNAELQVVGETFFVVTDPARLSARVIPQ